MGLGHKRINPGSKNSPKTALASGLPRELWLHNHSVDDEIDLFGAVDQFSEALYRLREQNYLLDSQCIPAPRRTKAAERHTVTRIAVTWCDTLLFNRPKWPSALLQIPTAPMIDAARGKNAPCGTSTYYRNTPTVFGKTPSPYPDNHHFRNSRAIHK